jgi:hypothetical protein
MNTPRTRIKKRQAADRIARMMAATPMVVQGQLRIEVAELSSVVIADKNQSLQGLNAFDGFAEKVAQLSSMPKSSHTPATH